MADLSSGRSKPANTNEEADDLLSVLKREAHHAIQRIAEQLHIPHEPRTGLNGNAKYRLVCQAYEARRARPQFFDPSLFADPAWDILLAMFREYLASRPMTVADVVAASDVPQSSAMRWLAALVSHGVVELLDDEWVTLTPEGVARLDSYIEHLQSKALMRVV